MPNLIGNPATSRLQLIHFPSALGFDEGHPLGEKHLSRILAEWVTHYNQGRLGEELVGSYLYQVHLYHWLESHDYGRFLSDNDL